MNNSIDNLDTDYYVERAYELRRVYVAAAMKAFVGRIKAAFKSNNRTTTLQGNPAH